MEKGCAERIEGKFKDRIQDVKEILRAEDPLDRSSTVGGDFCAQKRRKPA